MERWSAKHSDYVENDKIDLFLEDIIEVCNKHGLSISHEDHHGAFEIEKFNEKNIEWLRDAHDLTNNWC